MPTAIVGGAPTYFSLPTIFASRMPLAFGRDVIGLVPGEITLATTLHETGYATAAFCAANPYISSRFGYNQGFDVFEDFHDFNPPTIQSDERAEISGLPTFRAKVNQTLKKAAYAVGLGRIYDELYFQYCVRIANPPVTSIDNLRRFPSAEVLVDHAMAWIRSVREKPFFLWLHFMDPHSPYYPPATAFREVFGRELSASQACYWNESWNRSDLSSKRLARRKKPVIELYDAGIRSVDDQVARLIASLKQTGCWDTCTFVLTADHGEEFLEHGRRYHAPVSLFEEIAKVPLLIRVPAVEKKKVPNSPFSHLHLAPTLLEILEVTPPATFKGTSLWNHMRHETPWDYPAISECILGCTNPFRSELRAAPRLLNVCDGRYKLLMRFVPGAREELYDLETDPKEGRTVSAGEAKESRKRLLLVVREHLQKTITREDRSACLRARLRDLRLELGSNSR